MVKQVPPMETLEAAMRAANLRQSVIANNIANLDTPGFRRQDVKFGDILAQAIESGQRNMDSVEGKVFTPKETEVDEKGNDVDLDMEVGEMLKTSGAYKTYVRLLSKLYRRMESAIHAD